MNKNDIVNSVIGGFIVVALMTIASYSYRFYSSLNNIQTILIVSYCILIIAFLRFIYKFYGFRNITGIKKVDKEIKTGVSPDDALKLCKNNIKFLGIAANKLINSHNFDQAIKRCNRSGESIKFLLSHPDNPILRYAARRAGKGINDFSDMVNTTLRKLKGLKEEHGYNIEIRLYKSETETGPPSFRLFFVDNTSVLVSYYVFGESEGLQMPQIQLAKPNRKRDNENFYYAFEHYFNSLWAASEPCDEFNIR